MPRVYIAIGSNLNNPLLQAQKAVAALAQLPLTQFVQASPFYKTKPMGGLEQPDYINAVAAVDTQLLPEALLNHLLEIETAQGRHRSGERWQSRPLDLDILLYGDQVIHSDRLTIPHPGLTERDFVLRPLLDIDPDLVLPTGEVIKDCLANCSGAQALILA